MVCRTTAIAERHRLRPSLTRTTDLDAVPRLWRALNHVGSGKSVVLSTGAERVQVMTAATRALRS